MDIDIHRTDRERQELNRLIKEQKKDDTYKIPYNLTETGRLVRARKLAARGLSEKFKTAKGKREFRYALIGFMDNIGINRKYISEILKVHYTTITRYLYLKNTAKPPSSENSQNEK